MSALILVVPEIWRRLARADRGQTLVEYGLVLALVSIIAIVSVTFFGDLIYQAYNGIANYLSSL